MLETMSLLNTGSFALGLTPGLDVKNIFCFPKAFDDVMEHIELRPLVFYAAAIRGTAKDLNKIYKYGINLDQQDKDGNTLGLCSLMAAIKLAHTYQDKINNAQFLIDMGVDINGANTEGNTPIGIAANTGVFEIVNAVKNWGGNPDIRNNFGANALGMLIHDDAEIAKCLITDQTKFNGKNLLGRPLLQSFKENKFNNVLQVINAVVLNRSKIN